jgi:hypothetical protein
VNQTLRQHFDTLHSKDADERYAAFQAIMTLTQQPVGWAYEVWEELLALLRSKDNHQRTIGVQVLSSLAVSDPQGRLLADLDRLMEVTRDERFVTARHSLQCLWKVGVASKALRKELTDRLSRRYHKCRNEKNATLIRYDIIEVLRKIYDQRPDQQVQATALTLMESEADPKYRKKYAGLWKDVVVKSKAKHQQTPG